MAQLFIRSDTISSMLIGVLVSCPQDAACLFSQGNVYG
jgi:hypothetical protein